MPNYERQYKTKILTFPFLIYMFSWIIMFSVNFIYNYIMWQKIGISTIAIIIVFLLIVPVRIWITKRELILMYGDFMEHRKIIRRKEIYYNDIFVILYEPKTIRTHTFWYILLVDSNGETMGTIYTDLIGDRDKQKEFIKSIITKNRKVKIDEFVQGLLVGDSLEDVYEKVKDTENENKNKDTHTGVYNCSHMSFVYGYQYLEELERLKKLNNV